MTKTTSLLIACLASFLVPFGVMYYSNGTLSLAKPKPVEKEKEEVEPGTLMYFYVDTAPCCPYELMAKVKELGEEGYQIELVNCRANRLRAREFGITEIPHFKYVRGEEVIASSSGQLTKAAMKSLCVEKTEE